MSGPQLKECPDSPNCVSTQTRQKDKQMDPIPFDLDAQEIIKVIKSVVENRPRTKLVTQTGHTLHYTFESRIFGFVDDVEFLIDAGKKQIHFRSASRTGYSDLGVNRKRMTELREAIQQAMKNRTGS